MSLFVVMEAALNAEPLLLNAASVEAICGMTLKIKNMYKNFISMLLKKFQAKNSNFSWFGLKSRFGCLYGRL
jgi:hypothetical protein